MSLVSFTDKGLFCEQGGFYIDPWKPVDKAIITHAHSDHARAGSNSYLSHIDSLPLLRLRLGEQRFQTVQWNEQVIMNNVRVSLHPAGHIIGSSQIRIEYNGEVWVVSGDYKTENDGISGAFEPVPCNTFITESTFGLPIYHWHAQPQIYSDIQQWVNKNKSAGISSVLIAYSLGKAQRLLPCLSEVSDRIFAHGAIFNAQQVLQEAGWKFPPVFAVNNETPKELLQGAVVIAPPGAEGSPWLNRFGEFATGVCSGWMQVRGNRRRRNVDAGFALSDHADWKGLNTAIRATGAAKIFVTHGFQSSMSRYLNEQGIESAEVKTEFNAEQAAAEETDL